MEGAKMEESKGEGTTTFLPEVHLPMVEVVNMYMYFEDV